MEKEQLKQKIKDIVMKYHKSSDKNDHFKILSEIAQLRGGKIKEGEVYVNNRTKIIFIDKLGNEFKSTPHSIKSGYWSPYEARNINDPAYHMKRLEEIAKSKGGRIKEGEVYIKNSIKMIFVDKFGNEFKMTPSAVKSGQWSPYEVGRVRDSEYHMKQLKKIAKLKGGKIKEGEVYVNATKKITFIDKLGNEFEMDSNHVKNGGWSPYESGSVTEPEYHMNQLKKIAKLKGGKVKEGEKYINNSTKMTFIDQLGNEFQAQPKNIKSGFWSPYEKNRFEHVCRQIIEQLYNAKFNSCWNTIKRTGKRNLQLDGYCPELKIAFEYQGSQHTTGWAKDNKSLIAIKQRDQEKKQICINMGILLLEINYYKKINNPFEIIQQTIKDIKKSYKKNKLPIPDFIKNFNEGKIKIDFSKINGSKLMYEQIQEIAKLKDGKIKEGEVYINSNTKMIFIDKLGNEFKVTPSKIKSGQWSPYESKNACTDPEFHMKKLNKIAELKGGKIKEGEQYTGAKNKMIFIDKLGNEFQSTPDSIKRGNWSPYESGMVTDKKYHIDILKKIVKSKGGKIKEGDQYTGAKNKMTFIDKLGNEFQSTPDSIKRGSWSPYESRSVTDKKYHMEILKEIVKSKGGKIKEGEQYINANTKMIFIDQFGNEFHMKPSHIKEGRWSKYK